MCFPDIGTILLLESLTTLKLDCSDGVRRIHCLWYTLSPSYFIQVSPIWITLGLPLRWAGSVLGVCAGPGCGAGSGAYAGSGAGAYAGSATTSSSWPCPFSSFTSVIPCSAAILMI